MSPSVLFGSSSLSHALTRCGRETLRPRPTLICFLSPSSHSGSVRLGIIEQPPLWSLVR